MSISVYFLKSGVPDRDIPVRYFKSAHEVLRRAREFRASPMSKTHLMRIGGDMSVADERELLASGLLVPTDAYLARPARVGG